MAEDPSRPGPDQARDLVESISKKLGFVPEHRWAALTPEARQDFKDAFELKDSMIFTSVSTLANNLYGSSARFVFELLQNADDNSFKKAIEQRKAPYIAFRLYSDRIVVECNEDGFTYEDLKAISTVGKSSKAESLGYIGEKGIGFKSVFMVAWKVTIQSGNFSFFFKHRRKDQGLGMIRPIWVEPSEKLPLNMTRMTLQLHADSPEELESQRQMIRQQLEDLEETFLLFTRKLNEIRVSIYDKDDDEKLESHATFSIQPHDVNCRALIKQVNRNGEEITTSQIYHLTTHVYNLDRSENHTHSAKAGRPQTDAQSQIILGFPLSVDSAPIESYQKVYAFMPMKESGFKFLIQADFLTQASREDLVKSSLRNARILHAIADTFVKAVQQFREHPTLRYTWMRFLPPLRGSFVDGFWLELMKMMKGKLEVMSVLQARGETSPRHLIKSLRRCSDDFLDEDGDPLFGDLDPPLYISDNYKSSDLDALNEYGLKYLQPDEILSLLERDLALGAESRMMSDETDDGWHEQVATVLHSIISRPESHLQKRLCSLPILPVEGNKWAAPDQGDVYFQKCAHTDLQLPGGLNLTILSNGEDPSSTRGKLFLKLGVISATVKTVRESIFRRQAVGGRPIRDWAGQLQFLYCTHHLVDDIDKAKHPSKVVGHDRLACNPRTKDVYFPEEEPYSAHKLLHGELPETEGINLTFLHSAYTWDAPSKPEGTTTTWREWLYSHVGIRRYVKLDKSTSGEPDELSDELCFVAKHYPDKLMGFLRYHWQEGRSRIERSPGWIKKVRQLRVPCEGGSLRPLSDTFLHLPDLQDICSRFLREGEHFPFIKLDEPVKRGSYLRNWAFLDNVLGVGVKEDLTFYCHILATIRDTQQRQVQEPKRIMDIYTAMYGQYTLSHDKGAAEDELREFLIDEPGIMCPEGYSNKSSWCEGKHCIWDAPSFFASAPSLRWQFAKLLGVTEEQVDDFDVGRLFRKVVQVPLLDWKDIIRDLEGLSSGGLIPDPTVEQTRNLYHRLDTFRASLSNSGKDEMRSIFLTRDLIFNGRDGGGWLTVSQCLWSSATKFGSRAALSDNYEDLEDFFVDFLGVQTLNAKIVYDELLNQPHSTTPAGLAHLKSQLKTLSSFIAEGDIDPTIRPSPLLGKDVRIFPVRPPGSVAVELAAYPTGFVIIDRPRLGDYFADKVTMLDFDLDENRYLLPLFGWLGIKSRLTSQLVKEISTVDRANIRPVPTSDCKIRRNFKALGRIAYHFGSLRLEKQSMAELLETLQNIQLYETDDISSELRLNPPGRPSVLHNLGRSELHIHESDSCVEIFVPRNKKRREFCYASKLPSKLFEWLMTHPDTQLSSRSDNERGQRLVGIILSSSRSIIPEILDGEGIVHAGVDMDSEDDDEESSDSESLSSETLVAGVGGSVGSTAGLESMVEREEEDHDDVIAQTPPLRASSSLRRTDDNHSPRVVDVTGDHGVSSWNASYPANFDTDTDIYRRLLERAVTAARRASFPTMTTSPLDTTEALYAAIDAVAESSSRYSGTAVRFRSMTQLERDKMVGAAGELYVFELLKSIMAPAASFSLENWESTIRHLVRPHPDYADITRWTGGRETSDIVYDDVLGTFTATLVDRGYLDHTWSERTPKYLLEVKTTTGPCETAFFMSDSQYRRMRSHQNSRETVYIVLRVFNINSDRVGLRVYVDPAALEDAGGLLFTAGAWSVVPGQRRD